jgi:N-acetylmuramoyl-L-alanine amidase
LEYSKVFFNIDVQGDILKKYIKHTIFGVIALIFVIISVFEIKNSSKEVMNSMPTTNKVIVLDAGHGGIDPGTMNDDKTILEKDINLAITLKLRELIESSGGVVILTREDDSSLYVEEGNKSIKQKYNENLRNRRALIQESEADLFLSIHMNALSGVKNASKYYGAQTFYATTDENSKTLAQIVQEELKRVVDEDNERKIKSGSDKYILKENSMPSILIECGFLSNEKEANLLTTEKYQEKIAWAIYVGIQKYFSEF